MGEMIHVLPEWILVFGIFLALIVETGSGEDQRIRNVWITMGACFALGSVACVWQIFELATWAEPKQVFYGAIQMDGLAIYTKTLLFVLGLVGLGIAYWSREISHWIKPEQGILIGVVILSGSIMGAAQDLLIGYLALETVSIMSYALVGFNRTNNLSSEASTKYVLYGAISSGTMLFGLSLLYGLTGQMDLVGIQQALVTGSVPIEILSVVLLMVFAGFAFKISAFPLYMWTPDVYQGSPTPIAALLSVGPKAASIALLMRFILFGFSDLSSEGIMLLAGLDWPLVLSVMAAFTMTIGNLAALNQTSAKRLLAYSSIAQAGYLLMGFSVATESGFEAVLFYLLVYMAMNLGAFMVVALLYNRLNSDKIRGYSGLVWKEPFLAVMAAIFVFSLIGLPPFGGFVGKLYLFSAVVEKSLYWLAVVGVLNTVISVYYYIGLVRSMFLGKAEDGSRSEPMPLTVLQKSLLVLLAVPTLVLGVYWAPAKEFAKLAIEKTIW